MASFIIETAKIYNRNILKPKLKKISAKRVRTYIYLLKH